MSFSFIRTARLLFPVSMLLVVASLVMLVYPGPRLSIEFTGGTLMELTLPEGKTAGDLENALHKSTVATEQLAHATVTQTHEGDFFVRSQTLTNEEHLGLLKELQTTLGGVEEKKFTTIGPTVGETLKQHAFAALAVASLMIIVYLAIAFRKVPRRMSPWKFGASAVVAVLHDLAITTGIFTILSYVSSFQMDTLFVTAMLSIMGYSVMDTIVIFDRIRENLGEQQKGKDLATIANESLIQTLGRTLNTVICALIMLVALCLLGPGSIRWFILTLILGTVIGTYSSFFIATPLLVYWRKKS